MHELFYLIVQMLLSAVLLCTKKGQCLHEYNFSVFFRILPSFQSVLGSSGIPQGFLEGSLRIP